MPENKSVSIADAATLVKSGDTLALGGVTLYRRPMSFVRALLHRKPLPVDLTLLCFTAALESDLLVGAGCVRRIRTCYFGLESFGFAPNFSAAVAAGALEIIEESEASLALGIRATLQGVGFVAAAAWQGTDMLRLRPDVQSIADPYTGETLTAFPAITCDVAVLHALEADRTGNARLNANWGIDRELSVVAKTVIITAEEIVDRLTGEAQVLAPVVTAVVHAPRGAWPTSCYPCYPLGGGELMHYVDECAAGRFAPYLEDLLKT